MTDLEPNPETNPGEAPDAEALCAQFRTELDNFVDIFHKLRPHSPEAGIGGVEIYGQSLFLSGAAGGDHIVYIDFDRRYDLNRRVAIALEQERKDIADELEETRRRIGILLADVSGHRLTDALVAAMLHQAFLTGVMYELDRSGTVSTRLFEHLNTRFYQSVSVEKYITMIYGEISEAGSFRFISAGHPKPLIFSAAFDTFVTLSSDRLISFYPLGMFPSAGDVDASRNPPALRYKPEYTVNEVNLLGAGDVLLLYTDGFSEHGPEGDHYMPDRLERRLREVKQASAQEIFEAIRDDALTYAPQQDDMSLVVIKRRG